MSQLRSVGLFLLSLLALVSSFSCVGAPRSPAQLEAMDDVSYERWVRRVERVSFEGGRQAVLAGANAEKVEAWCRYLEGVVDPQGFSLSAAVADTGIDGVLVSLLVDELQALLDERGGFPGGVRGQDLLSRVAAAVRLGAVAGAAPAVSEGQPSTAGEATEVPDV